MLRTSDLLQGLNHTSEMVGDQHFPNMVGVTG